MNFLDWLGTISGYKRKYELCSRNYAECISTRRDLEEQLEYANELIKSLMEETEEPPPPISRVERSPDWIREKLKPLNIVWLQLDGRYFCTTQDDFLNIVAWDWTDNYSYERTTWDCDKFAVRFKSQVDLHFGLNSVGVIIDYAMGHAYNLVVFADGNIMLLEPQTDQLWAWAVRPNVYLLEGAFVLL